MRYSNNIMTRRPMFGGVRRNLFEISQNEQEIMNQQRKYGMTSKRQRGKSRNVPVNTSHEGYQPNGAGRFNDRHIIQGADNFSSFAETISDGFIWLAFAKEVELSGADIAQLSEALDAPVARLFYVMEAKFSTGKHDAVNDWLKLNGKVADNIQTLRNFDQAREQYKSAQEGDELELALLGIDKNMKEPKYVGGQYKDFDGVVKTDRDDSGVATSQEGKYFTIDTEAIYKCMTYVLLDQNGLPYPVVKKSDMYKLVNNITRKAVTASLVAEEDEENKLQNTLGQIDALNQLMEQMLDDKFDGSAKESLDTGAVPFWKVDKSKSWDLASFNPDTVYGQEHHGTPKEVWGSDGAGRTNKNGQVTVPPHKAGESKVPQEIYDYYAENLRNILLKNVCFFSAGKEGGNNPDHSGNTFFGQESDDIPQAVMSFAASHLNSRSNLYFSMRDFKKQFEQDEADMWQSEDGGGSADMGDEFSDMENYIDKEGQQYARDVNSYFSNPSTDLKNRPTMGRMVRPTSESRRRVKPAINEMRVIGFMKSAIRNALLQESHRARVMQESRRNRRRF